MKIMTFNIQHGVIFDDPEKRIDLAAFADYINEIKPDIVGLNEVRGIPENIPEPENINEINAPQAKTLASLTNMNYYFAPALYRDTWLYGNAILSRFDIVKSEVFPILSPKKDLRLYDRYEDRCLLKATLSAGGEEINVFVCHMGLCPDECLGAVRIICRELDKTAGKKLLMGDFNATPTDRLLSPIFKRMNDAADKISGSSLTFPSNLPRIKIDYIFASKEFDIISAEIPESYVSDHRVHIAEIE